MVKMAKPSLSVTGVLVLACLGAADARAADTLAAPVPAPAPTTAQVVPSPVNEPANAAGAAKNATPAKAANAAGPSGTGAHPRPSHYAPDRFAGRAGINYRLVWGVDSMAVRLVESNELVRFTYRVLDPAKAQVLNDKQAQASMNDPKAAVTLLVPTMEKVGPLRQTPTPEAGRSYWVTFSNKGRHVKRGDRVEVVIGQFRANNLVVD
jgi:hypothetical protein